MNPPFPHGGFAHGNQLQHRQSSESAGVAVSLCASAAGAVATHGCDQMPDKKSVKGRRLYSEPQPNRAVHHHHGESVMGKVWPGKCGREGSGLKAWRYNCEVVGLIASAVRKQRDYKWVQAIK